jgi:hypothetical protein
LRINTAPISILAYVFAENINAIMSINEANPRIDILVLRVIERDFEKLSRCFLYKRVDRNQLLNLSDPRMKQNDASNKKGTVGSTGKIVPIAPSPKHINPKTIYITLNINFSFC